MRHREVPAGHVRVYGRVVRGQGPAGGPTSDPRFPDGALALQWPRFEERGLDLSGLHRGTVDVATTPTRVRLRAPAHTFEDVRWHPDVPPETFSFVPCQVSIGAVKVTVDGWVYRPHPGTEANHQPPDDVLELLLPWRNELHHGAVVRVDLPADQVEVDDAPPGAHPNPG